MELASLGLTNVGFDRQIIGEWNYYESYGDANTGINNTRDFYTYTSDGRVYYEGASINGQAFNAKNELYAYWFTAISETGENKLYMTVDGQTWYDAPYTGGNALLLAGELYQKSSFLNIKYPFDSAVSDFIEDTFSSTPPNPQPNGSIISSVIGKGKLKGSRLADAFTFDSFDVFSKKGADKIIGFDASDGDTIAVSQYAFPALKGASVINFASTNKKKKLRQLSQQDYDFVYFEKKGRLYFDGNGSDKGWGDATEGGLVAIIKGRPELTVEDLILLN